MQDKYVNKSIMLVSCQVLRVDLERGNSVLNSMNKIDTS